MMMQLRPKNDILYRMIKDKNSSEWLVVKKFCEDCLKDFREENDNEHDLIETSYIRGKIAFAKQVLELGSEKYKIDVKTTSYIE